MPASKASRDLCLRQARAFLLAELQRWRPEVFSGTAAVAPDTRSIGLLARQDLAAHAAVLRVLEAPALYRLFQGLLQACRPLSWLQLELTHEPGCHFSSSVS